MRYTNHDSDAIVELQNKIHQKHEPRENPKASVLSVYVLEALPCVHVCALEAYQFDIATWDYVTIGIVELYPEEVERGYIVPMQAIWSVDVGIDERAMVYGSTAFFILVFQRTVATKSWFVTRPHSSVL